MNEEQCHLLIVDKCTRFFSWTFFLKTRDEAFSVFLKFKTIIEAQHSILIKNAQSDGARKFKPLARRLEECGVIYRLT